MQITRLVFGMEVNGLNRKQRLTVIYVPSAAKEMILTSQCPFELFCKTFPVTRRA